MLPDSNSSPVLLALRATNEFKPKLEDYAEMSNKVDVVPIDCAVNQVLGERSSLSVLLKNDMIRGVDFIHFSAMFMTIRLPTHQAYWHIMCQLQRP